MPKYLYFILFKDQYLTATAYGNRIVNSAKAKKVSPGLDNHQNNCPAKSFISSDAEADDLSDNGSLAGPGLEGAPMENKTNIILFNVSRCLTNIKHDVVSLKKYDGIKGIFYYVTMHTYIAIGDGNCFYRSVSFLLDQIQDNYLEVRKFVANFLLDSLRMQEYSNEKLLPINRVALTQNSEFEGLSNEAIVNLIYNSETDYSKIVSDLKYWFPMDMIGFICDA